MLYLSWWYYEEPLYLWRSLLITTNRVFKTFSIALLFRTLFYPWKKDVLYKENPSLSEIFQIWIDNSVSRFVGAIVRLITIFAGLITTILVFIFGLILIIVWLIIPIIILYLMVNGTRNLNG